MKNAIHIFYKDLNFHPSLYALAKTHRILPVFLWSEHLNQGVDLSPSIDYRYAWARVFNHQLLTPNVNMPHVVNAELIIRLCKVYNIDAVSMLKHYEPREVAFQTELEKTLKNENIQLILSEGYAVCPLGRKFWYLENTDFTLHTYREAWYKNYVEPSMIAHDIEWIDIDLGNDYALQHKTSKLKKNLSYLSSFQCGKVEAVDYNALNNLLSHGVISAQTLLSATCNQLNRDKLFKILSKRDYAYERLYYYAGTERQLYGNVMDIAWEDNAFDYQSWCEGQTRDSRVNDIMRTLYDTGTISDDEQKHVANYLTKTLKVNWREGVRWFREHLVSFDLAQCIYLWQSVLMLDE